MLISSGGRDRAGAGGQTPPLPVGKTPEDGLNF